MIASLSNYVRIGSPSLPMALPASPAVSASLAHPELSCLPPFVRILILQVPLRCRRRCFCHHLWSLVNFPPLPSAVEILKRSKATATAFESDVASLPLARSLFLTLMGTASNPARCCYNCCCCCHIYAHLRCFGISQALLRTTWLLCFSFFFCRFSFKTNQAREAFLHKLWIYSCNVASLIIIIVSVTSFFSF